MASTVAAVFGIDPFRIGGVETYTRELARQLERRGAELVSVFSRPPQGEVAEYLRAPNLRVEAIPELETSMRGSVGPLAALLRKYRPRVLHFQFVNFVGAFPWVGKLCGAQQIFFTAQGSNPSGYKASRAPAWKRAAVRIINGPVSRVFCISDYTRRALADLDILPPDRFEVLYNAIAPPCLDCAARAGAQFRERFSIPADRELVTQVSWIIPEKGIPQLLEAAQIVLRERPDTHFAVVGNGSGETEFRRRAESMGISRSITWTGLLQNPMQEGVYAASDVFCLASQWQEAFGWVLAEAMAFEKPVVATAVGGIPEVVEDQVTGLLVRPANDSAELARKLLRLLNDAELRRQMGAAGRCRVEDKFHLERNVAQLLTHYAL
jgi:glycosyltransferase involved in cell wall biosynthesis